MRFATNDLALDLNHILEQTPVLWEDLRGARLFITGATGFFGSWLLEAFCHANEQHSLGARAVVLSRDPLRFLKRAPHLAGNRAVEVVEGDLLNSEFPDGEFSHVIHAAIDYCEPRELFLRALASARRTLDLAVARGARRYLLTSSGAVYGRQPTTMTHLEEQFCGAPDPTSPSSAYGEAKRSSEFLCAAYHSMHGLHTTIARGFAFVGPYLPLDQGSAIGNFIGDALHARTINVNGDGTPVRSYLYGADLAIWLWTILLRGEAARAYNVGAEATHSIAQVAQIVAEEVNPRVEVCIAQTPDAAKKPPRYVPSTQRARTELGLKEWIDVREGVRRTAAWYAGKMA